MPKAIAVFDADDSRLSGALARINGKMLALQSRITKIAINSVRDPSGARGDFDGAVRTQRSGVAFALFTRGAQCAAGLPAEEPAVKKKLGPYEERIGQILNEDKALPKKQRHTAKQIWERLRKVAFFCSSSWRCCIATRCSCGL